MIIIALVIFSFLALFVIILFVFLVKMAKQCDKAEEDLRYSLARQADMFLAYTELRRTYDEWYHAQAELEQVKREAVYELVLYTTKEFGAKIERAQFMTGIKSPQQLSLDALVFYIHFIEQRSKGHRLFIGKNLSTAAPVQFDPLNRVKPKTNN